MDMDFIDDAKEQWPWVVAILIVLGVVLTVGFYFGRQTFPNQKITCAIPVDQTVKCAEQTIKGADGKTYTLGEALEGLAGACFNAGKVNANNTPVNK